MARKANTPPDRIRGFTSLADHEAASHEGKVVIAERDGYPFRRIWHDGEWWHSVVDVVGAIAESENAGTYWRVLKKRLGDEGSEAVTFCNGLKLTANDGKMRETDCATTENLFRIIQSIPSPRAEPIKQFLAQVGAERLQEMAQPSKAVDRAMQAYRDKGRDDEWIDGRLQNISSRNELTDEWKDRGAGGVKAAPITAAMSKEMLGVTPAEHRDLKRIDKKVELRDHMDNLELAVTTLGERAAKAIIVARDTKTFVTTKAASLAGAKVAGDAARRIEEEIKRPIANSSSFLPKPEGTARIGAAKQSNLDKEKAGEPSVEETEVGQEKPFSKADMTKAKKKNSEKPK